MRRAAEPESVPERELLLGWLQFHRDALAAKCEGMSDAQLVEQSAPPSTLSLLGLVRHLTEMEGHYLGHALSGDRRGFAYCTDEDEEADIEHLGVSMVATSQQNWQDQMSESDDLLARYDDLSADGATGWFSVRWSLLKVIQEYARHNGHADIVRERIDGLRGE
ncbi:MAG: DinB family protein [Nocardioidaceae bacterium]